MTTREKIAHLMRRFGLGATQAELDELEKLGLDGAIEHVFNYEKQPELAFTPVIFAREQDGRKQLNVQGVVAWWALRMLLTKRPLEEQLTLFWHDHFAVSASKVTNPYAMAQHLNTLRRNASGSFLSLLEAVSKDAAMIVWLDNNTNVAGRPNENFARELLELFTMGIGHYTEEDIQEISRAFTGWNFRINVGPGTGRPVPEGRRPQEFLPDLLEEGVDPFDFMFQPRRHDAGRKKFLGNEGLFSGEEVLQIVAARPETARCITTKLFEWFAYEGPSEAIRERLARTYYDRRMNVKAILRVIVESDEFWSERCVRRRVKNPVDFVISLGRQVGIADHLPALLESGEAGGRAGLGIAAATIQAMERMGMRLLFPPDVAGWDHGTAWTTSATMIERIRFADALFGGPLARGPRGSAIAAMYEGATSSEQVVEKMLKTTDADIPADRRKSLIEACEKEGGVRAARNPRQAAAVTASLCRVLFAAPEFQFC